MRMALSLVEFDLAGDANGDGIVNESCSFLVIECAYVCHNYFNNF